MKTQMSIYIYTLPETENLDAPNHLVGINVEKVRMSDITVIAHPVTKKFKVYRNRYSIEKDLDMKKLNIAITELIKYMEVA